MHGDDLSFVQCKTETFQELSRLEVFVSDPRHSVLSEETDCIKLICIGKRFTALVDFLHL